MKKILIGGAIVTVSIAGRVSAGTMFGASSNFDAVNDTGSPCNGMEIELDDIQSKDVTYTLLRLKTKMCAACLDAAAQGNLGDLVTNFLEQNNGMIYCAGTGPLPVPVAAGGASIPHLCRTPVQGHE